MINTSSLVSNFWTGCLGAPKESFLTTVKNNATSLVTELFGQAPNHIASTEETRRALIEGLSEPLESQALDQKIFDALAQALIGASRDPNLTSDKIKRGSVLEASNTTNSVDGNLGLDSLMVAEAIDSLEKDLKISQIPYSDEDEGLNTVQDMVDHIKKHLPKES